LGEERDNFISGGRKSIFLFKDSQAMHPRCSDKDRMTAKMFHWQEVEAYLCYRNKLVNF
jgi:hypothetical protein